MGGRYGGFIVCGGPSIGPVFLHSDEGDDTFGFGFEGHITVAPGIAGAFPWEGTMIGDEARFRAGVSLEGGFWVGYDGDDIVLGDTWALGLWVRFGTASWVDHL